MNTHDMIELPPLPKRPEFVGPYTAKDMQAYALAAIEAVIHPEVTEFELIQDGIPVAGSSGPREGAWREIQHYAAQYSEDGPVEIYEVIRRRIEGGGK